MTPSFDDAATQDRLLSLVDGVLAGETVLALAIIIALAVGAAHALAPGHGKALVAAWVVADDGRPRDVLALAGLVAIMHTASVLALGLVVVGLGRSPAATRWPDIIMLAVGLVVIGLGIGATLRHRRGGGVDRAGAHLAPAASIGDTRTSTTDRIGKADTDPGSPPEDPPDVLGGAPTAPSPHDHHHGPETPGIRPWSRAGLLTLAATGGLLPSPGALALLATATAVGRPGLGLVLVASFGVGLATSLGLLGLAMLRGRAAIVQRLRGRHGRRIRRWLPMTGAFAITAAGAVIAVRAIDQLLT